MDASEAAVLGVERSGCAGMTEEAAAAVRKRGKVAASAEVVNLIVDSTGAKKKVQGSAKEQKDRAMKPLFEDLGDGVMILSEDSRKRSEGMMELLRVEMKQKRELLETSGDANKVKAKAFKSFAESMASAALVQAEM